MTKITFMGAGSTVFSRTVLGDCMSTPMLRDSEIALYDIDAERLDDSRAMLQAMNEGFNEGRTSIRAYLGVEQRKEALRGADFVINAVQVGGYEPATVIDFEIPKKYGLRQTIGDTLGIGGIMRTLRTIPVLQEFAEDIAAVCPKALFLNYTNPMAMLTGYLLNHTAVNAIGLCHSVQVCSELLLRSLGMDDQVDCRKELIAGINHMGWLLRIENRQGEDLYPEIRRRARQKNASGKHGDMVRFDYIERLGYYCTESSEHNAEYNPFYIKPAYPELIERFNIPLDEYPRRCIHQISEWKRHRQELLESPVTSHHRSHEYASRILEAVITNQPYKVGGNVSNRFGVIANLPHEACVEVPCLIDGIGVHACSVGNLPEVLAAMNRTNINVQLLTIEAAVTLRKDAIYQAAMLDPHTGAQLSIDDIVAMVDELIAAHGAYLPKYR